MKSTELSQDLTQDIFIKVWERRKQVNEIEAFHSYLFTVSKNASFNFLKRAALDVRAKNLLLQAYPPQESTTVDAVVTDDYMAYLRQLLDSLTPQSREVFRLCRQESMTYDEAAAELGISRNTVKKHMVRTMRFLSVCVERDLGIPLNVVFAMFCLW